MTPTQDRDTLAKDGINRIMIEDARSSEDTARNHSGACNQEIKRVNKSVKGDNEGRDGAGDTSKRSRRRRARLRKKAAKAARKLEGGACLPALQVPKTEPLHTVRNDETRTGQLKGSMQTSSKKRIWDEHAYEESPQKTIYNSNETVHITGKKHSPIEVIQLYSSDDDNPKLTISPHSPHTGTHYKEVSERDRLQTAVIDLTSANDRQEPEAMHLTSISTPLPSHIPANTIAEPPLCPEQSALVELILSGRNVFYTGSAGCGKSTVLKAFVKRLKEHPTDPKKVDIIAPTGRAALDINGSTFWTYAGWTPDHMKKPVQDLRQAAHGKFVKKRLRETDVLVIDEVSMMENHHFERLNQVMKEARGNNRPFGDVQLVVTGDFCQLPPVKPFQFCLTCGTELQRDSTGTLFTCNRHGTFRDSDKWAFLSLAWEECQFEHVNLTSIHRQTDADFIAILQKCRLGVPLSPKDEDVLLNHESQTGNAVRLFSTREEVRVVNKTAFDRLPSQKRVFRCYDNFICNSAYLKSKERRNEYDDTLIALRDHRFDPCIELKHGMQVVLLVNLDIKAGLVNGSQGVITGFEKCAPLELLKAKEKNVEDQNDFSFPILNGEHAEVREANIRAFIDRCTTKELPIVLFQNRITKTIWPDCRVNELGDEKPYSLLSRTQIPLVAGWAMTVHKSQGMTLNRVVVNLSKSFEEGQLYVALSRARSLQGLKVEGLGRQQGRNEQVRQFLWERFGIR